MKNKIKNWLYVYIVMASLLILFSQPLFSAETDISKESNSKVEQETHSKTVEKRKQIVAEAVTALDETKNALKALDEGKNEEALSSLEKATGKLEIVLTRDPELALAPIDVTAYTQNLYASLDTINKAKKQALRYLEDGRLQEARRLIDDLASETVIRVENIPLATRAEIEFAQALGYGNKKDFNTFYKEINMIEKKTSGGKSGKGLFDILNTSMKSMSKNTDDQSAK